MRRRASRGRAPQPPVRIDASTIALLSRADQQLGRLDGLTQTLPNPDLFVAMYVRREAVLSSQIEGTESTIDHVLAFELEAPAFDLPRDVEEVVKYVRAMNYGLERLATLPLSLRLVREIHGELMQGVRGGDRFPGEFRRTQNWIGPPGTPLGDATFVPPAVDDMKDALHNFESFLHDSRELPTLVHAAIAHAQFETIHPFLDGNGRVGRLLITFLLCHRGALHRPLLCLSSYLWRHRSEYYECLSSIRDEDDWERWVEFFPTGAAETAEEAIVTARAIVDLREQHRALVQDASLGSNGLRLVDLLFERPLVNVNLVKDRLDLSFVTANKLVDRLTAAGLLTEITGGRRNRVFRYSPYLALRV